MSHCLCFLQKVISIAFSSTAKSMASTVWAKFFLSHHCLIVSAKKPFPCSWAIRKWVQIHLQTGNWYSWLLIDGLLIIPILMLAQKQKDKPLRLAKETDFHVFGHMSEPFLRNGKFICIHIRDSLVSILFRTGVTSPPPSAVECRT